MNPVRHFQRGSLVICDYDFERERSQHGHSYPHKGDLLIVRGVGLHSTGEQLCTFEELYMKLRIPLASRCFVELQTPEEGDAILRRVKNLLTK